jgi:hypothetical protein
MSIEKPAARLFVLLARSTSVGIILRRGPSNWVQLIKWDTRRDIFTPGQWFHGRIYEHRCDISPSGNLLIYDAYKPGNEKLNPEYGNRWTAISKPPYFTALALWKSNSRTYGGGYFMDRKHILLNHPDGEAVPHPNHLPPNDIKVAVADYSTTLKNSIYFHVLRRDGWRMWGGGYGTLPLWYRGQPPGQERTWAILQKLGLQCTLSHEYRRVTKPMGRRGNLYERIPHYRYQYIVDTVYEYSASYGFDVSRDITKPLSGVTWADYDQHNRLVLAKEGKLFSGRLEDDDLYLTEIADFNSHVPENISTPNWAKRW